MVWIFLLFTRAWSLHFYLLEGYQKCFVLDQPSNTVILANYDLLDLPPKDKADQGILIKVLDPQAILVFHRMAREKGKFSFTTQANGKHKICLVPSAGEWLSQKKKVRFELQIDNVNEDVSHEHLANQDEVQHLFGVASTIRERLADIAKQQEYSREKEAIFKDESEDINSRVLYLTLFQTLVILSSGVWQILSLRNFFKEKKLL